MWSLPATGPTFVGQRRLDVHVDVLERRVPPSAPAATSSASASRPATRVCDLVLGQDAGPPEAADVGDRARDVVGRERGVDLDRAREVRDARVGLAAEPAAPGPHRASVVLRRSCYPADCRRGAPASRLTLDLGVERHSSRRTSMDAYRSRRDRAGEAGPLHPDAPDRPCHTSDRPLCRPALRRGPEPPPACLVVAIRTIVVYPILSKQFLHGLTLGSTKARRRPATRSGGRRRSPRR